MVIFSALLGLAGPWPLAIVIDAILGRRHLPGPVRSLTSGLSLGAIIAVTVVAGLLLTVLAEALGVLDTYVNTKLNMRLVYDFRSAVYEHAQRLSLTFHDRMPAGQLMYRIGQQTGALGQIVVTIPPIVQMLLTAVGMLVVTALLDWQLALVAVAMIPLVIYSTRVYAQRILPRLYEVRQLEMQSTSIMYEGLAMIRVIMSFGREGNQLRRWRQQALSANEARIGLTLRQTLFSVVVDVITAIGSALVLGLGAAAVLSHHLSVGDLVVLLGYVAAIYQPIQQTTSTFGSLQQQFVNLESALELFDLPPAIQDAPDAVELPAVAGRITFENVDFRYEATRGGGDGGDPQAPGGGAAARVGDMLGDPALQVLVTKATEIGLDPRVRLDQEDGDTLVGVSFEAQPGRHVALVGPTGAGKTTILSLIMRFYEPTHGSVLLDGVDLRQVKVASLRDQISIVLQEPVLFAGTIAENILYGKPEATEAELIAATKAANAHDFIVGLPDQYETIVGERGAQISQGERQRISVARAFLRDAPILLLDEPTSSIDSQTEAVILAALGRLMEGRTTFTVAHRLSTVRRADLILVVEHGRLVQKGTHSELLARPGLYKQLHDYQFGTDSFDEVAESEQPAGAARTVSPGLLAANDLLVAAFTLLLEDGSVYPLEALFQRLPKWLRHPKMWLLIGALLAALRDGNQEPLRELAAQKHDSRPDMAAVGRAAEALLEERRTLDAISLRLDGRHEVDKLDVDLLRREPWTQVARVSPQASRLLRRALPTGRLGAYERPLLLAESREPRSSAST